MPGFNLNNATDFARATLSQVSGAVQSVTGLSANKWVIREAAYAAQGEKPLKFHIFENPSAGGLADLVTQPFTPRGALNSLTGGLGLTGTQNSDLPFQGELSDIRDQNARRKVVIEYPYRDGQTTNDLGRKGESFEFNVILHGQGYLAQYQKLKNAFNKPTPGVLTHPIYGDVKVAVAEWEVTHQAVARRAMAIRVRFIEHSFEVSFSAEVKATDVKSALSKALSFLGRISSAVERVQSLINVAQGVRATVQQLLEFFNTTFLDKLQKLNSTFNGGSSADLPALLPTNQGGASAGGGAVVTDTFGVVTSPNDPFAAISSQQLSATTTEGLAILQAIDQVKEQVELANATIRQLEELENGQGALIFFDEIQELQNAQVALQEALEAGLASSNARVVNYVTPRLMTIREVAFDAGLDVERVSEIEILNPSLLSVNYIPEGTQLLVPIS